MRYFGRIGILQLKNIFGIPPLFYNSQSTQNNTIMKKIKLLVSVSLLALTCNYANATNNVQETDFKINSAETSSPQPPQSVKKRPQSKTTAKNHTAADKVYDVSSLINAATAYQKDNNLKKAAEMYHKAYDIWAENLKNNVPGTKRGEGNQYMRTIINMYADAGLYEDALMK